MDTIQKTKKRTIKIDNNLDEKSFTPPKKNCPKGYQKNKRGRCVTRKIRDMGDAKVDAEVDAKVDAVPGAVPNVNTFLPETEKEYENPVEKSLSESQYIPKEHPDVSLDLPEKDDEIEEVPFTPKKKNCPKGYHKNKFGKCEKTKKMRPVAQGKTVKMPPVSLAPSVKPPPSSSLDKAEKIAETMAIEPIADAVITPVAEVVASPLVAPLVAPLMTYATEKAIESVEGETLSAKTKNIRNAFNSVQPSDETSVQPSTKVLPKVLPETPDESSVQPSVQPSTKVLPEVLPETSAQERASPEQTFIVPSPDANIKSMNDFLREKERIEYYKPHDSTYDFLYPSLNDSEFSLKLALKKEFADTKYDGEIRDIEKYTDLVCNTKFELSPHQIFVRNFMSVSTPYKSILLYHGLGTGKTCSSIGIAEETRQYYKQIGLRQKIFVVASPNVQGNFRQQLFNESKLTKITNIVNPNEYTWNIESCVGNSLLREINPNSIRNLSREKLVSNINSLINDNYLFMGYIQLANYIAKVIQTEGKTFASAKEKREYEIRQIQSKFNNVLIIIDEVHNIRLAEDNKNQTVAVLLMKVAKYAENMRLVLLSATPMFNSYKEIVWLTNLMNLNDKRSMIEVNDVFDSDGNFKPAKGGKESGEDLLVRKLTGYISYVRDENPYLFPARIYPSQFKPENTLSIIPYPSTQMNGMKIDDPIEHVDIYITKLDPATYQTKVYRAIMKNMSKIVAAKTRGLVNFEEMETFLYTILHIPLEVLNIAYPHEDMMQIVENGDDESEDSTPNTVDDDLMNVVIGSTGLSSIMNIEKSIVMDQYKINYEYKPHILSTYKRIFSPEILPKYSAKMAQICDIIRRSEGIILVYSQYIDGGVVPFALALEEMGFARYNSASSSSLFNRPPAEPIDALKMLPKSQVNSSEFHQAKYIMITGDKILSPSNTEDVKYATNRENMNGSKVKVILISKAGSEGLDFKFIRQVHILEPWYNMNRIEQIIGRGVRNLSHCGLEFAKRNCQLYLHSTIDDSLPETADMYVYRVAEKKAIQIGKITRLMKEIAVDCVLNISQTNFTAEKLAQVAENRSIKMKLSERNEGTPLAESEPVEIAIQLGDKGGTTICDYMETCNLKCRVGPNKLGVEGVKTILKDPPSMITYQVSHSSANQSFISQRIRQLFRENHVYSRNQIVASINTYRIYPLQQIFHVLSSYLENQKNEYLVDKYGRFGYLVNRGEYYYFQPVEISDQNISVFERTVPVEYKKEKISLELPKEKPKIATPTTKEVVVDSGLQETQLTTEEKAANIKEIIDEIHANYILTQSPQMTTSGEKNWYKRCSQIMEHMRTVYNITEERLTEYIVYHALDTMEFNKKMRLLREMMRPEYTPFTIIETKTHKYFKEKILKGPGMIGVVLVDGGNTKLMVKYDEDEWKEGNTMDIEKLEVEIMKLSVNKSQLNQMIGYIVDFKEKEMVFKFRDLKSTVNRKGQRCDAAGKQVMVQVMEKIGNMTKISENYLPFIHSVSLCVLLEMVMRDYTYRKVDGRIYYLTPEQTLMSNIMAWSAK